MSWYKTGTITLTNGSATVTGSGTAWIANAAPGEGLQAPDGKIHEIASVVSDTQITLAAPFVGASASGLAYSIVPSQSYIRDLASSAAALLQQYANVAATAGAGKFGAGTANAPGISFVEDQDTGIVLSADGQMDLVSNGKVMARINDAGVVISASGINNIGTPGVQGFGVGVCPGPLPSGMSEMAGTREPSSANYGNYQFSDGSIMVWMPAFYYKWGTGSNGLAINDCDIKPFSAYNSVATAAVAGYALHRAFYDGGAIQPGVFVDKYQCSNNGGTASSIQNGNPLSSAADHNPFSGLTGAPANAYDGAIVAAKTRGAAFFCNSRFIFAALAMLSYAHGRASASTTYCAWWHATNNFPKGNNNNALRDANDTSVLYVSDGYSNCGKTGSANLFARTTHNGQACGVADLNGNMWEITPGLTSNGTNLYVLKETKRMRDLTSGASLATDLWGATGIAENYNDLGTSYEVWREAGTDQAVTYGSASQVFSAATSGNAWNWAGAGGMLATGDGGTNAFGNDGFWDYKPVDMCPLSGGDWGGSSLAGVWALYCGNVRGSSGALVGFRAALYL